MPRRQRLGLRDVQRRPGDGAVSQGGQQGIGIDHATASGVDQEGRVLHGRQFLGPDQRGGLGVERAC